MKQYFTLFFVFILLSTQCNSTPLLFNGKNNFHKGVSIYANRTFKIFTPNEGLPQSSIMSIAVDKTGYLWIGTQDGAAYYDGRKWTTVNLPNRTVSNYIQSIFVASDSAIWLSADRGQVHRLKSDNWKSFGTSEGLASNVVNCIQETKEKTGAIVYWFGSTQGLSKYSNGKWKTFTTKNSSLISDYIYNICKSKDGSLWIGTNQGVSKYTDGTFQNFTLPKELQGNTINKVIQGKNGELWFAGAGIVGRFENNKWTIFHINNAKINNRIIAMYETNNGDLWLGSANGIMRIPNASNDDAHDSVEDFFTGTEFENLMGDIFCITETRGGQIWFGTLLGLFRYIPGKWKTLNENTGLKNTPIIYIYETQKGSYLFGTPRGLFLYQKGSWKKYDDKSGLSNNFIKSILEATDGTLWVGTLGGGVDHLVNGKWHVYEMNKGLSNNLVYSMIQSNDGALWFATANGVSKYYKGKWTTITTADGLAGNQVMSLYQSKDGSIWFGTRSGLSRFNKGQFQNFNTSNGLCGNIVQSINSTSDGSIWFGTTSGGVSQFNPISKIWKTYNDTTSLRLSNNVIYQVEEDRFGRLYFLTNKGVTRFSSLAWLPPNEQIAFKSNQVVPLVENFSVDDGLPSNEGMVRAAMVDAKGRIWVGTTQGIAYFDPAKEITDTLKKDLLIEKINIQKLPKEKFVKDGIKLNYYENNISFEYALLSYFKESKTLYRSQLEPYEESPNGWSNNFRKEYTNLPNGTYIFRVWGKDYAGNISGPTEFTFIIQPPFWKEWWFIGSLLLIFIGVVNVIIKFITTQKLKKQLALLERQKLIEHERGRISKDMHDSVGSSLTRIAILSDRVGKQVNDQNPANDKQNAIQGWVELIGLTAREVIDTMNEIIWSLSPSQDNLESLINYTRHFINSMFETTDIHYLLDIPEYIPNIMLTPDFRRNMFLIIKEIINNIIKHSNASNVSFSIILKENSLFFEAKDDGIGINKSQKPAEKKIGFGLKNMMERSESIGAELNVDSTPNLGTTTRIKVALQKFQPI